MLGFLTNTNAASIKAKSMLKVSEINNAKSIQDTIRFSNNNFPEDFVFVMRDKNVNAEKIYTNVNGELFFNTNQTGYFRTKQSFENYKLHAEWKWPKETKNGNSGVLIHTQMPDSVWPECVQVQLKQMKAGDLIAMNGAMFEEAKEKPKDTADKFSNANEKEENEWNNCNIICNGDSIVVYVNGTLQNKATKLNVTKGTIGFQLEGKPVYFRNIYLIK